MSVYCVRAVPAEARKGHHLLWNRIDRQLRAAVWVLGIKAHLLQEQRVL